MRELVRSGNFFFGYHTEMDGWWRGLFQQVGGISGLFFSIQVLRLHIYNPLSYDRPAGLVVYV